MHWIYLILAIAFELIGTTLMKISYGFTKLIPTIGTFMAYVICFTLLSLSLKKIEVGIAYAIWSAVGIVVLCIIGIVFFKESVSLIKVVSIIFILIGVMGLYLSN
ncbi:MAG: multidrug efflux SMR transporter [Clostridiaceae bacterium]|nr:multidrug efflux SMR transporter [Clostridiaceae bacterium]